MATFLTPAQIQAQYLQILKSLKPDLNINDPNSDFVIRGKVFSGLTSGVYGDQKKVNNDTYISSARPEALLQHGEDYDIQRQPATQAQSPQVRVPGVNGTIVGPGDLTFQYTPTGVIYTNTTGGTVAGGFLDVAVQATTTGQIGNVAAPDDLTVVSPPTGITSPATIMQNIADGADIESFDSYRARLLARRQSPPAGGTDADIKAYAFAGDPSVRSASIRRFGRGLGTVDLYITTGTTDIDTAVTQGFSIVRIPGPGAIANVQDYINSHVPLTDCDEVFAPTEINVNATMNVELASGITLATVPASADFNPLGLTVENLIKREMGRAIYKFPVGGRFIPSKDAGFVVASDIEASVDVWLSANPDPTTGQPQGRIPVLVSREIQMLSPPDYDLQIIANELPKPNVMTVIEGGLD